MGEGEVQNEAESLYKNVNEAPFMGDANCSRIAGQIVLAGFLLLYGCIWNANQLDACAGLYIYVRTTLFYI